MVLGCNLGTGEGEIMTYHCEGGTAEDLPEREYITAIQLVINSKCMTAKVSMKSMDSRSLP